MQCKYQHILNKYDKIKTSRALHETVGVPPQEGGPRPRRPRDGLSPRCAAPAAVRFLPAPPHPHRPHPTGLGTPRFRHPPVRPGAASVLHEPPGLLLPAPSPQAAAAAQERGTHRARTKPGPSPVPGWAPRTACRRPRCQSPLSPTHQRSAPRSEAATAARPGDAPPLTLK